MERKAVTAAAAPSSNGSSISHHDIDHSNNGKIKNGISPASSSSSPAANNNNGTLTNRRRRKRGGGGAFFIATDNAFSGNNSMLGIFLLAGLIVCILDSIYIVNYLSQRGEDGEGLSPSGMMKGWKQILKRNKERVSGLISRLRRRKLPASSSTVADATTQQQSSATKLPALEEILSDPERAPLIDMLRDAKMDFTAVELDKLARLPKWSDVVDLYGSEPIYIGLDTCQNFSGAENAFDHFVTTAGTFNSGTNLMAELLIANCHMPKRMERYGPNSRGVRWEAIWGKHTPIFNETFRQTHRVEGYKDAVILADNMFPAVTVRDPLQWMPAMCRHTYGAYWLHTETSTQDGGHCPNLLPNKRDYDAADNAAEQVRLAREKKALYASESGPHKTVHIPHPDSHELHISNETGGSVQVAIHYSDFVVRHNSLVHFWNEWYLDYLQAKWPRLLVRMEDLVFYPKQVTKTVCECAGGKLNHDKKTGELKFKYVTGSAKRGVGAHGTERTGLLDAMIKYGTEKGRYDPYTPDDLVFANAYLDPDLMKAFQYKPIPSSAIDAAVEREAAAAAAAVTS